MKKYTKEQIKKIFERYRFLKDKCDSANKALEWFIKKVSDNKCDAFIHWDAVQWFIDALSILDPELWEEFSWYTYEFDMFTDEEIWKWVKFEKWWKIYIIYNNTDFLEYLLDNYTDDNNTKETNMR